MNIDFSTLPLWVNKKFYPLWFDRNRFIIKKGGAGCIHGESLLHTPQGKIKIKDFKGGYVYSWNGKNVVPVYVPNKSKKYKKAPLYEVKTKEGQKIICTAKHRFLTNYGWLSTSELLKPYLVLFGDPLNPGVTTSGTSQKVQSLNVHHSRKILQGYQSHCFAYSCLYDGQPQLEKETVSNVLPSPIYVDEHTRLSLKKDGPSFLLKCIHSYRQYVHLSKNGLNVPEPNPALNLVSRICDMLFVLLSLFFQKPIQFLLNSFHQKQVDESFRYPLLKNVNNLAFNSLHVESITYKGVQVYYDISVPPFNNYIAEGMIHHNSGKSVDTFRCATYRMIAEPGHNYIVARKSGKSNSTSTLPLLKSCISDWNLESVFDEQKTTQTFTSKSNGNQMRFIGLDDLEKVKSVTFPTGPVTDIIIEEATEITEKDFRQLNLRLRGQAKQPFQMTLLFNPVSDMHWMKNIFFDNPGKKKGKITIHESTYHDNRFIDAEYKEELEALKYEDRVYYDIYALGKWGSVGNLVFRNIKYGPCPYKFEDFDEVLAGMDYGYNHYHAIELIGMKDGVKYSFDELYVRHMTNDEIIKENEAKGVLDRIQKCVCDSAEPKSIKDWSNAGYNVEGAKKGPDSVRQHISWLNRGVWHIDPEKCPGLASETKSFKWKEDRNGNVLDEPVKFKDDAIAACRYAIEEKTEYQVSMLDVL